MSQPAVKSLGSTWTRLVEGSEGWTALPLLAAFLCLPALISSAAAAASQIAAGVVPTMGRSAMAVVTYAGVLATSFGMLGLLSTPPAALLVLVLSLLRRWRLRVIGLLWLLVIVAMATMLPAIEIALSNWVTLPAGLSRPTPGP